MTKLKSITVTTELSDFIHSCNTAEKAFILDCIVGVSINSLYEPPLLPDDPVTEKSHNDLYQQLRKILKLKSTKKNDWSAEIARIIDYLNEKAQTDYKTFSAKNRELISRWLNEDYVIDQFFYVIDNQCIKWKGTDYEWCLRPQTLFGDKFESYVNAPKAQRKNGASSYISTVGTAVAAAKK